MRIAVIAASYVPSITANSIQVMKVCQAFVQAGCDVDLWIPARKDQTTLPAWDEVATMYGITNQFPLHWIEEDLQFRRYDFAWKAVLQAKKREADVVYTWMPQAALFSQWCGLPYGLELHMLPSGKLGPWMLRNLSRSHGKKLFLPITHALQKKLGQSFDIHFRDNEVQIAPMGTEPERYERFSSSVQCKSELGLPEGFTAAYTGHLYQGRGMDILVGLAEAFPKVTFLWIGGHAEDVAYWQQQIQEKNLSNIVLTGFMNNAALPQYQAAADVLLMPYSRSVGISGAGDTADVCSPMKLFDYLAAGRVILTSDLPVIHEVLNDENAVFVPADDLAAWVDALGKILHNADLRQALSVNAANCALAYSWRQRAERTVQHFLREL